MGGALTHISVGIVSGALVYFLYKKLEFSFSIFLGNLLPDAIKFGLTAVKQQTLALFYVDKSDSLYRSLSAFMYAPANWFSFGFFIFLLLLFLYHFHYIKKKSFEEYEELYVFLLVGVIIHLVLDVLVIETSVWI